jgi:ribonucleoside-diphosphate reductase alpha chain
LGPKEGRREEVGTVSRLDKNRESGRDQGEVPEGSGAESLPTGPDHSVQLSENALRVLEKRYLRKDDQGRPVETPEGMFRRVARAVAQADLAYGGEAQVLEGEERFFRLMTSLDMMPNSPTLMNAGRELGQLSACFVLPVGDSMESIFGAVKDTALIHKSGGGTGFSFSSVRPRNDQVKSTRGISSGPISFMTVFDAATETIKQGGMRRGANMAVLAVDHPDIQEFITCKQESHRLNNFNISVALTESFMEAVEGEETYELINPRTGEVTGRLRAVEVFDRIVGSAWRNGEPGILFMDRINRDNPTPALGRIESTNPCGEQPLLPFESCNLGSLNLARAAGDDGGVDWERLRENVRLSTHFLDNVIDANRYPLEQIERMSRANRKIGLGVMGFADLLIRLGIPYDSEEATRLAEKVMEFIAREAVGASEELAERRGPFPNFERSLLAEQGCPPRRNATTTTIAPTGTISLICGCSSGIEPLFAIAFVRNVLDNERLVEIHPLFETIARKEGFYSDELIEKILQTGSVQGLDEVPERWRRIFVTSHDISPEWHIRMQAAFQKHTENSVSKTVNFPEEATEEDVREVFWLAYRLGCKGVTIYRDRSREHQVLQKGVAPSAPPSPTPEASEDRARLTPRPRPEFMRGLTKRMDTSCGALYVTINWDDTGRPFEVFTSMGKAGGCASSQSEAIGRLASLALRSGVDPEQVARQLRGISCHLPRGIGKKRISSCADAVAQALQFFLNNNHAAGGEALGGVGPDAMGIDPSVDDRVEKDLGMLFLRGACPDCQGPLEREGGCSVCRNCGYSDCL